MRRITIPSLCLAGLTLALAACGGSAAVTGPDSTSGPAAAAAPTSGSAVVEGSVVGAAEGLRVSVVGTSLSGAVDEEGQFALVSVPAGTVTLRFAGSGVDAQLAVPGVVSGQVTSIKVTVSAGTAAMSGSPRCAGSVDTYFTGQIASIAGPRLTVSGRAVDVSQVKKVWRGSRRIEASELKVGEKVKVWGALRSDGVVAADEITLLCSLPGDDGTSWVAFSGRIEALSSSSREGGVQMSCTNLKLVVAGRTVFTSAETSLKHSDGSALDPSELKVGQTVYVEGWLKPDGSVRATYIRL